MAIYIEIKKVSDTTSFAEYIFGVNEAGLGKIKLDKGTGEIQVIEPAAGDEEGRLSSRAAHKIKKHWAAGELPEVTCWAS